jgi:hypothetical protein
VGIGLAETGNQSNAPHKHVNVLMGCITFSPNYPFALTFANTEQRQVAHGNFCGFVDDIAIG